MGVPNEDAVEDDAAMQSRSNDNEIFILSLIMDEKFCQEYLNIGNLSISI
jgi:hypothetical protein